MKKELTEEQIENKKIIKDRKKDIALNRIYNIGNGLLIGISSLGLVAGSLLGITGATLFAVGQHKMDMTIATYMASEDFRAEKAEKLNRKGNLENMLNQLQEYQKEGYYSEENFTELKQKIEEINNESDFDYAKRILFEDENNELHGILKDGELMYAIGAGLLGGSGMTFFYKTLGGALQDDWSGAWGQDLIDVIEEAADSIMYSNDDIARGKEEIKALKNNRKEPEESNEENNENEDKN